MQIRVTVEHETNKASQTHEETIDVAPDRDARGSVKAVAMRLLSEVVFDDQWAGVTSVQVKRL